MTHDVVLRRAAASRERTDWVLPARAPQVILDWSAASGRERIWAFLRRAPEWGEA